jgi:hypothetical protein
MKQQNYVPRAVNEKSMEYLQNEEGIMFLSI